MLTTRAHAQPINPLLAAVLLAGMAVAACGGAAGPSPTPGVAPTPRPTPTAVPGDPGSSGGSGGGGSDPGTGSGPGGGDLFPLPQDPNQNPLLGDAHYVAPAAGLVSQRTVNVQLVRAIVEDDGSALVDLRWWSGIAPCSQLDHVEIDRDDGAKTIHMKVIEGSGQGDVACIDIAQLNATVVDLGALPDGTWTISAEGDAPPTIPLEVR